MAQPRGEATRVLFARPAASEGPAPQVRVTRVEDAGHLFLALITGGRWGTVTTPVPHLAAKAMPLDLPVDITPEALQQRMTERAVAVLQELLSRAFTKLHTGHTIGEKGIFAPFSRVRIAHSPGFGLPASLQKEFPGAGGSDGKAGAKIERSRLNQDRRKRVPISLKTAIITIQIFLAFFIFST